MASTSRVFGSYLISPGFTAPPPRPLVCNWRRQLVDGEHCSLINTRCDRLATAHGASDDDRLTSPTPRRCSFRSCRSPYCSTMRHSSLSDRCSRSRARSGSSRASSAARSTTSTAGTSRSSAESLTPSRRWAISASRWVFAIAGLIYGASHRRPFAVACTLSCSQLLIRKEIRTFSPDSKASVQNQEPRDGYIICSIALGFAHF